MGALQQDILVSCCLTKCIGGLDVRAMAAVGYNCMFDNLPCICGPYGGGGELDTVLSFFILYNNVAMTTTATANSPPIHPSIIYSVV